MIQVVTFLWNDENYRFNGLFRYGADHVNRWALAVRRNLTIEHEIVCITDGVGGLDPSIRVIPLWDDLRDMGGCYTRLRAFSPDMKDIIGPRFVWMDVDCVITGNLDPLFSRTEDFVIWSNGYSGNPYCGSMVMMDAGARRCVWDDFGPDCPDLASRYVGTDQAWIAHRLGDGEATWTQKDGVLSRYDVGILNGMTRKSFKLRPKPLRDNAKIVFFHGPVDPSLPEIQENLPWIKDHWR